MSKAAKTKEFIIEKIAPVFNTKGYTGTSLADITAATGLTKGGIYGNFANKDEVALAAFDFNVKKVNGLIRAEMEMKQSVTEKMLVYVSVYDNLLKNPLTKGGCAILNTATEADDTHPALRQKAADALVDWKNKMAALIAEGIREKEFRKNLDPEQVALTVIAMIEGGILIAKLTGKANYRRMIMQSVEKLIKDLE